MIAPIKKWGGSLLLSSLFFISHAQSFTPAEISRWEKRASATNIIRDKWGIAHIMGKTDADAVFGLLYAQCEDDFPRVEMNYIEKLGRMAEVTGEKDLYEDLLIRLIIDTADAKKDFQTAPVWLKSLLQAYADGINYYLYKNPGVRPALLQRFEPWFPLLWTDGSIGAIDIAEINVNDLKKFYGKGAVALNTDTKKQIRQQTAPMDLLLHLPLPNRAMPFSTSIPTLLFISARKFPCKVMKACMYMVQSPGDNSLSTRDSMNTAVGCIHPVTAMWQIPI